MKKNGKRIYFTAIAAALGLILFRLLFPAESALLSRTLCGADARETFYAIGETVTNDSFEHSI